MVRPNSTWPYRVSTEFWLPNLQNTVQLCSNEKHLQVTQEPLLLWPVLSVLSHTLFILRSWYVSLSSPVFRRGFVRIILVRNKLCTSTEYLSEANSPSAWGCWRIPSVHPTNNHSGLYMNSWLCPLLIVRWLYCTQMSYQLSTVHLLYSFCTSNKLLATK